VNVSCRAGGKGNLRGIIPSHNLRPEFRFLRDRSSTISTQDAVTQQQIATYVVGTAGHVDHGKSTLVQALTGIDPDRLAEEKERQLTIDLGFAWFDLPSGRQVSVVDVPGHERFIKNMLAGVGGIDAALLVIAADEGPMPQTEEHLDILGLLEIERGLVVLTKIDVVEPEWRELVVEEIRERLQGTAFATSQIVAVSALKGEGIEKLSSALDDLLANIPPHTETGKPRLPIDRVFTVSGFGTIVTGTLLGGPLEIGQEIELQPSGIRTRVRGLQSHQKKVETAYPGRRTAVNLTGVSVEDVVRGDVITAPGWLEPTTMLDARVRVVENAPFAMEQNDEVDFFVGSSETVARITLLDSEKIDPGQEGWIQIRFPKPVATVRGDRFIIRRPSPSETIGGGLVIDPHPRRHRRFRQEVIQGLEALASGSPEEILLQTLGDQPRELRELYRSITLPEDDIRGAAYQLLASGDIIHLKRGATDESTLAPADYLISWASFRDTLDRIQKMLGEYHQKNPLRKGMAKEEVRSRIDMPQRAFEELVSRAADANAIVDEGNVIRRPQHEIQFAPDQRQRIDRYLDALQSQPFSPPSPSQFDLDTELVMALNETGEVVRIDESIVFTQKAFADMKQQVLELINQHGSITLAQVRDHFGTSRKYAQAVLEYFDHQRITRRVGDERVRNVST
jgi:selenocysteine-specific elongation factor